MVENKLMRVLNPQPERKRSVVKNKKLLNVHCLYSKDKK